MYVASITFKVKENDLLTFFPFLVHFLCLCQETGVEESDLSHASHLWKIIKPYYLRNILKQNTATSGFLSV